METPDSGHTLALAALARKIVVWKEIRKTTECLCVGNGRLGRMQFEVFLGGSEVFCSLLADLDDDMAKALAYLDESATS